MAFAHPERSIHTPLPQTLSSMFPSCSSQSPDHPNKPRAPAHESHIITHAGISPSNQSEQPGAVLDVRHWEDFPSPWLLRDIPGRGCSVQRSTLVVPAGHAEYNTLVLSEEDAKRNLAWKGEPWGIASSSLHHYTRKEHVIFRACWKGQVFLFLNIFFFLDNCLS